MSRKSQGTQNGLPIDWKKVSVGELTVRTKQRDPRRNPTKSFRYVDVSSVSNSSFRIIGTTDLMGADAPSRARKEICTDDILFATVRPTLKRVALVPPELNGEIASTGFIVLRAERSRLEPRYLYSRLLTDEFIKRMGELERGANYPAVRDTDVLNEVIPVPPLPEQRRIAWVLGLVQRAMDTQERLLALTAELKNALLQQLFAHRLKDTPDIAVPDALTKFKIERTQQLPSALIKDEGRWPVVDQGQSFVSGYTDDETKVIRDGLPLVIFGDHTRCVKFVDFPFVLGADGTKVLKVNIKEFRPKFFYYALAALDVPSRGYNRHFTILKEKRVKRPAFAVQDEVVERFTVLDRKLSIHERKHMALSALFRTLLHELMTAQIRVHNLDLLELGTITAK